MGLHGRVDEDDNVSVAACRVSLCLAVCRVIVGYAPKKRKARGRERELCRQGVQPGREGDRREGGVKSTADYEYLTSMQSSQAVAVHSTHADTSLCTLSEFAARA